MAFSGMSWVKENKNYSCVGARLEITRLYDALESKINLVCIPKNALNSPENLYSALPAQNWLF